MRKVLLCLAICIGANLQAAERVYVATDRNVYIAGDKIWCSLFCADENKDAAPAGSAVAYLELISADGTAASAKISLLKGRGAGIIQIPTSTPTGNYRLVAYTAAGGPEGCFHGASTVSIFNTSSTARVRDGVLAVTESQYSTKETKDLSDGLEISGNGIIGCGKDFSIILKSTRGTASMCLSVFRIDGISVPESATMSSFFAGIAMGTPAKNHFPEYEGEIIRGSIRGSAAGTVTLSSAGSPSDVYLGRPQDDGSVLFFTNNIYGDRELVCSSSSPDSYLVLEEPFQHPVQDGIPPLKISASMYSSLVARKAAVASGLPADTLFTFLPRRQDHLLDGIPRINYHLDDYTRFNSLKEIFVEIIHELSLVKAHGKEVIRLAVKDPSSGKFYQKDNTLIMLDGVVLNDITPLKTMDALLLNDVDLYSGSFAIGGVSYGGAVNFITKQNYVKAINFPANVRVVDFRGVSYPLAYLGAAPNEKDFRQLLYWHPLLEIEPSSPIRLSLRAPSSPGSFLAVAQGISEDGSPVRAVFNFKVE